MGSAPMTRFEIVVRAGIPGLDMVFNQRVDASPPKFFRSVGVDSMPDQRSEQRGVRTCEVRRNQVPVSSFDEFE